MTTHTRRIGRTPKVATLTALAVLALAACGGGGAEDPFSEGGGGGDTIVVGSANFPENELLMQMYAQALEAADVTVETQPNIGAREVYMKAFEDGDIDLLPEYNGALLAYLVGEEGVPEDVTSPFSRYDSSAPLYSGSRSIEPSSRAGR